MPSCRVQIERVVTLRVTEEMYEEYDQIGLRDVDYVDRQGAAIHSPGRSGAEPVPVRLRVLLRSTVRQCLWW
jgi:hypothetical protein